MKASKGSESGYSQGLPGSTLGRIILLYLAVRCKHGRTSKRKPYQNHLIQEL